MAEPESSLEPVPATMFDKIWRRHIVLERDDGKVLLYIDRVMVHDGNFHAFAQLRARGLPVARPLQTLATPDHYAPTLGRTPEDLRSDSARQVLVKFEVDTKEFGVPAFPLSDPRQGIVHVVGPEQGFTLPGLIMVCGDSHTSTNGGLGALAFGIGVSEVAHVLATQTIWQTTPRTMRISVAGKLKPGVAAKDLILSIIGQIGTAGATGHVVEYAGEGITALSIEERLTVCNMSIEAGARGGLIAPDDKTFDYLRDRTFAPKGMDFDEAVAYWRTLPSDFGAVYHREVSLDCALVEPMITWGTNPQMVISVTGNVPGPDQFLDPETKASVIDALDYMGLEPGMALTDVAIDQVFIGSCTNSRIEDLRAAAAIACRGRAVVPAIVSPGSTLVKTQAEREGLDRIFRSAGFEWREAGCSMCIGMNGDLVEEGKRCASTSNRNFRGRQGHRVRTHLVSPAMAAAAALAGRFVDVRQMQGS